MPDPRQSGNVRPRLTEDEKAARLASLNARFGPREDLPPYYLTADGDWIIGTIDAIGEFTHDKFGASPQLTISYQEGESLQTAEESGEPAKGTRYMLRLFPKAAKGRTLAVGQRVRIVNYGSKRNKADTFDYQDIDLTILDS